MIDEDYRGEVRVLLFNHEDKDFTGGGHSAAAAALHLQLSHPPHPSSTSHHPLSFLSVSQCTQLVVMQQPEVLHAYAPASHA